MAVFPFFVNAAHLLSEPIRCSPNNLFENFAVITLIFKTAQCTDLGNGR